MQQFFHRIGAAPEPSQRGQQVRTMPTQLLRRYLMALLAQVVCQQQQIYEAVIESHGSSPGLLCSYRESTGNHEGILPAITCCRLAASCTQVRGISRTSCSWLCPFGGGLENGAGRIRTRFCEPPLHKNGYLQPDRASGTGVKGCQGL